MVDMSSGTLLAVCRVHALLSDSGPAGVTAIDKRPVDGPVKVRRLGLYADIQADRQHHGGEDQAIYAYAQEEAEVWARELGRAVPPGLFGENFRTQGIATTEAVIGEQWRIGDGVLLEVTAPRIPCATFARRMGEPQWVRRFTAKGMVGTYLRVLAPGTVRAGDRIDVVHRPDHGVTVGRWFRQADSDDAARLLAADAAGSIRLAAVMQAAIGKRLRRSVR
jgi:MOSC domain-containing protein YiiM